MRLKALKLNRWFSIIFCIALSNSSFICAADVPLWNAFLSPNNLDFVALHFGKKFLCQLPKDALFKCTNITEILKQRPNISRVDLSSFCGFNERDYDHIAFRSIESAMLSIIFFASTNIPPKSIPTDFIYPENFDQKTAFELCRIKISYSLGIETVELLQPDLIEKLSKHQVLRSMIDDLEFNDQLAACFVYGDRGINGLLEYLMPLLLSTINEHKYFPLYFNNKLVFILPKKIIKKLSYIENILQNFPEIKLVDITQTLASLGASQEDHEKLILALPMIISEIITNQNIKEIPKNFSHNKNIQDQELFDFFRIKIFLTLGLINYDEMIERLCRFVSAKRGYPPQSGLKFELLRNHLGLTNIELINIAIKSGSPNAFAKYMLAHEPRNIVNEFFDSPDLFGKFFGSLLTYYYSNFQEENIEEVLEFFLSHKYFDVNIKYKKQMFCYALDPTGTALIDIIEKSLKEVSNFQKLVKALLLIAQQPGTMSFENSSVIRSKLL